MPKYVFECHECAIRFERVLKMSEEQPTHSCPSCKEDAPRLFEDFGLSFKANPNAPPANSGVHDLDYPSADKAVGRSATDRWATYQERKKVKDEARKQGNTHALIRHDGDGYVDYEPMTNVGLDAHKKLTKAAIEATKVESEAKKASASKGGQ